MKYSDGKEIRIGDRVRLGDDDGGVVVCDIGAGEFTSEYPESSWGYLKKGIVVVFPKYGAIHMEEPESDLEFIARRE